MSDLGVTAHDIRGAGEASSAAQYRDALVRWSAGLAAGRADVMVPHLAAGSTPRDVARYIENAVGERYRMLMEETRLVALAFDDFDAVLRQYLAEVPRVTFDPDDRELTRFLRWLLRRRLTARQRDFIAYQQAECDCLLLAARRRAAYRQFHELAHGGRRGAWSVSDDAWIHLNPACVWSRLSGIALGGESRSRRYVLFFAVPCEVRMLALEPDQIESIRRLETLAPCSIATWAAAVAQSCPAMARFANALAEQKVIAMVEHKSV